MKSCCIVKEKYKQIARFYQIHVEERDGLASRISWEYLKEQSEQRFSGAYFLRTDRFDLSEKAIWSIYTMLTQLEDAFRTLKLDLLLRPVFHQKEHRSDAHIFITLLAYHLLHSIRACLKQRGIHMSWRQPRDRMSTHCRVTNRMKVSRAYTFYPQVQRAGGISQDNLPRETGEAAISRGLRPPGCKTPAM